MNNQTWVPFFEEFANKILEYKDNRSELIDIINIVFNNAKDEENIPFPYCEHTTSGKKKKLTDIDPFWIVSISNRYKYYSKYYAIFKQYKKLLNMKNDVPDEYYGVPIMEAHSLKFYKTVNEAPKGLIDDLWEFYKVALNYADNPNKKLEKEFIDKFNQLHLIKKVRWNLTVFLYDIRPNFYINLDSVNQIFCDLHFGDSENYNHILNNIKNNDIGREYLDFCSEVKEACLSGKYEFDSLTDFSYKAYEYSESKKENDNPNEYEEDEEDEDDDIQYWICAPGKNAYAWDEFYEKGIIGLGWSELGDLSQYKSREDIQDRLSKINSKDKNTNASLANWEFCNSIQEGDVIYAKKGKNIIVGKGIVESDYLYNENESEFHSYRKVNWLYKGNYLCPNLALKTLTEITYNQDLIDSIEKAIKESEQMEKNRIIYGAPGTGKSYRVKEYSEKYGFKMIERVTFHSDYIYANFVGSYKPKPKFRSNGDEYISYEFVAGPFIRVLKEALINPDEDYLLIIEEINRANTAAVFGDVFQLLDRDEEGESEYLINVSEELKIYLDNEGIQLEDDKLYIPSNMFIWATMNNADQGVYPLDTAFKRRWSFEYLGIDYNENKIKDYTVEIGDNTYKWNDIRKAINNGLIKQNINEDKLLGPFFIDVKRISDGDVINKDKFNSIFKEKVLMYLFEDAAKHKRNEIFTLSNDTILLSKLCSEYDSKGLDIFVDSILSEINKETSNKDTNEETDE